MSIHTIQYLCSSFEYVDFWKKKYIYIFVSYSGKFNNPYYHNLDDQLTNIQNDLNGNKQKIEDANGVIKRHTEQLIELEPEINDLKHEMSELDRHVKGKYLLETI